MWPPQSVNTWPTPAPLSVRATSSPPVIQSQGAAPSEPPRLSSRQPPRFTDSPRPAGPQPRDGLRLALPHPTDSPRGARRRASAAAVRLARPHPQTRLGPRGPRPPPARRPPHPHPKPPPARRGPPPPPPAGPPPPLPPPRRGRRAPSPATPGGSPAQIHSPAPRRASPRPRGRRSARTATSTDSPRGARRRASAAAARLARPHPQARLGRRGPSPATACGSHCHSPEFLPLDGLAVEALGDEDVANAMDHRLAPADVGDEPGDVGDQTRDRLGEAARSRPRGARSARPRPVGREAGGPPRERSERRGGCEPARGARPRGERRASREARRVELGQDRADRHDTDLLGDKERTPRIGAGKNEAAKRPLEGDGVAGLEAPEPLRADSAGRHVGAEREPRGELRRRGDRVGADGLRAERDRHPLARGELERGRLLQPKVDLQDLG